MEEPVVARKNRNPMAEDFRLPIFDFRLNRSLHFQSKIEHNIENQKLAQQNDAVTANDEVVLRQKPRAFFRNETRRVSLSDGHASRACYLPSR